MQMHKSTPEFQSEPPSVQPIRVEIVLARFQESPDCDGNRTIDIQEASQTRLVSMQTSYSCILAAILSIPNVF